MSNDSEGWRPRRRVRQLDPCRVDGCYKAVHIYDTFEIPLPSATIDEAAQRLAGTYSAHWDDPPDVLFRRSTMFSSKTNYHQVTEGAALHLTQWSLTSSREMCNALRAILATTTIELRWRDDYGATCQHRLTAAQLLERQPLDVWTPRVHYDAPSCSVRFGETDPVDRDRLWTILRKEPSATVPRMLVNLYGEQHQGGMHRMASL